MGRRPLFIWNRLFWYIDRGQLHSGHCTTTRICTTVYCFQRDHGYLIHVREISIFRINDL